MSGGHSHIVMVEDYTKMKIIGKTRDDAAGEAFDKAARTMGMPYPGGIEWTELLKMAIRLHSSFLVPQFTMRRMISAFGT